MEKKNKKKWVIILLISLLVLSLLLAGGYIAVNKMFSVFSDSFYKTSVQTTSAPNEGDDNPDGDSLYLSEFPDDISAVAGDKNSLLSRLNLTASEFQELSKKVSFNDKVNVLNILSSGLQREEYSELLAMLSNGITTQEIHRAYDILRTRLSGEDKEKVLAYYNKYINLIKE